MEVTVEKTLYSTNVYIDGLPHIQLKHEDYRGLYSYIEGYGLPRKWGIDFYYKGMEPISVQYDTVERWTAILTALKPFMK